MSPTVKPTAISPTQGFTLIELVVVLIVLGVLAATTVPKLTGRAAFEEYTVRDQLIARLRLVQLQAMNGDPSDDAAENACYWLVVKNSCLYHEHTAKSSGNCSAPPSSDICAGDDHNQYNRVFFSDAMLTPAHYRFDLQGRLAEGSSSIRINGDNQLTVTIESEGYIHE